MMENIRLDPNRTLATEVLSFENVELEKNINGKHSFETVGMLNALYFRDYNTWILYLSNWKFVLLKQLPIIKATNGYIEPVTYILPFKDGFYTLRFNKVPHVEALQNFEAILNQNSTFKCNLDVRSLFMTEAGSDPFTFEKLYDVRSGRQDEPTNYYYESSQGGKLSKREILKRELIKAINSLTEETVQKRDDNPNLTELRQYEHLVHTPKESVPTHWISRADIDKLIIESRNNLKEMFPDPLQEGQTMGESWFSKIGGNRELQRELNLIDRYLFHETPRTDFKALFDKQFTETSNFREKLRNLLHSFQGDKFGEEGRDRLPFESQLPYPIVEQMKGKSPERFVHGRVHEVPNVETQSYQERQSFTEKIKSHVPDFLSCRQDTPVDEPIVVIYDLPQKDSQYFSENQETSPQNRRSWTERLKDGFEGVKNKVIVTCSNTDIEDIREEERNTIMVGDEGYYERELGGMTPQPITQEYYRPSTHEGYKLGHLAYKNEEHQLDQLMRKVDSAIRQSEETLSQESSRRRSYYDTRDRRNLIGSERIEDTLRRDARRQIDQRDLERTRDAKSAHDFAHMLYSEG